jgi:polyhydroxyalkanoate synthesis regulator phasin
MSKNRKIVEDNPNLSRDMSSTAIINTNKDAYEQRLARKNSARESAEEINSLKSEVQELKNLLQKLIEVNNVK